MAITNSKKSDNIFKMEMGDTKGETSSSSSVDGDTVSCCKSKSGHRNDKKKKKTKFTIKQKVALAMLALADFMCFCSVSIISPFYPVESARKGVSESVSGLVFGAYALVVVLTSPVFGKVLPKVGAKFIFISGLLLSGISSLVFGLINRIENYTYFVTASFIIRAIEALGASAYSTAGYVLIINIFPDNAGAVRGILETFVGLGISAGPGIGGLLYTVGGFGLPFYVVGIITIIIAFLNLHLLAQPEKNEVEKSGSLINLLKLPPVLVTCTILIVTSMTISYLDPTLEPHLRKFSLSASQVGLLFLLLSGTYGICSPMWGWLSDKMKDYTWLMTTGLFCSAGVLLFLGPSPVFTFIKDSIWLNAVALSALGIFTSMALIPTYQYISDSAIDNGFQESLGTHSVIAGLWSSVYSIGEVIGPVLGGTLIENFGFPITSTTMAFINFLGAILALIYFKLMHMNKKVIVEKHGIDNVICYSENSDAAPGKSSFKNNQDDNDISIRL